MPTTASQSPFQPTSALSLLDDIAVAGDRCCLGRDQAWEAAWIACLSDAAARRVEAEEAFGRLSAHCRGCRRRCSAPSLIATA